MTSETSPLAAAAAAALAAQHEAERRGSLLAHARERLAAVLDDPALDVGALRVAEVNRSSGIVVLTDGAVHLAVDAGDTVALVEHDGEDGWTRLADVTSLAELGAALAEHRP